jgi:isoleucyl-tRNA synthetase
MSNEQAVTANAKLRAGENLLVTLEDGATVELLPEEVLVDAKQKEGYAVSEEGGYVVALNTTVTPELKREGLLRDFVRFIQAARKEADFNVSDTITTFYEVVEDADGLLKDLTEALADPQSVKYVQAETLSKELVRGNPGNGAFSQTVDMEGAKLQLSLVKG